MTIKELYEKAVEGDYENLPLYDRIYADCYSAGYTDIEIDVVSIQVENDRVIFV